MSDKKVTIQFEVRKQTKNTLCFDEKKNDLGPAPAVGTLYVQKWALSEMVSDGPVPSKLTVTIEIS